MRTYKNLSRQTCVFYGVEFAPGEAKEVPGCIIHPDFLLVEDAPGIAKVPERKEEKEVALKKRSAPTKTAKKADEPAKSNK